MSGFGRGVGFVYKINASLDLVGNVFIGNQIIDPLLGNLQNNGGSTDSRLPSILSPAMNAGNNCVVTNYCPVNPQDNNPPFALLTDQRSTGFPRLIDTAVEIGAIELPLGVLASDISISGQVRTDEGKYLSRVTIRVIRVNGDEKEETKSDFLPVKIVFSFLICFLK